MRIQMKIEESWWIMRAEVKVEEKHDESWDKGSVPICDLGTWDMPKHRWYHLDSLRWYHLDQRCYSGCLPRFGVSTQGWFPEFSRVKSFMLDVEFPCYFCWVWSCFKMIRAIIYMESWSCWCSIGTWSWSKLRWFHPFASYVLTEVL